MTIDLKNSRTIQVSRVNYVDSGNRWSEEYGKIDALGLFVIGGRVGDTGVGGWTRGGCS